MQALIPTLNHDPSARSMSMAYTSTEALMEKFLQEAAWTGLDKFAMLHVYIVSMHAPICLKLVVQISDTFDAGISNLKWDGSMHEKYRGLES
ncbi:unnamed protein product [Ambrosiozyma monospora]|uniref:Unnamed protein product n=1 Tax=Ambrosiozyma monospora TaxID=43982 RepID=A0A9W6SZS6_AMBMO|nr:unnamed protein product [Ambrosiozyma monospora]